ncbi:MAG: hypothetical protein ACYCPQ_05770 [Elusimicrobiota bacterium]
MRNLSSAPGGGQNASFSATQTQTDVNGQAQTSFTLGSATGTYVAQAACPSCAFGNPVEFTEQAVSPFSQNALKPIFCDGSYPVGQSDPLIVQAVNQQTGAGVPNLGINYQIVQSPGGGSLSAQSAATDQNGESQSSLTLGPTPGVYQVQIACPDCQANPALTCPVTAIAPPNGSQSDPPSQPLIQNTFADLSVGASVNQVVPSDAGGNPIIAGQANTVSVMIAAPSTVTWTAVVVPTNGSGGHNHVNARPAGNLPGSLSQTSGIGNANLIFTSGQVGEQEEIRVCSPDCSIPGNPESDAFINVQVPGFQSLTELTSSYVLVGRTSFHPENHWGMGHLINIIQIVAGQYNHQSGLLLGINDMSLSMGGLFDIGGTWSPPHNSHREGTSVDVDTLPYIKTGNNSQRSNADKNYPSDMITLFEQDGCGQCPEATIHFECPATAGCQ